MNRAIVGYLIAALLAVGSMPIGAATAQGGSADSLRFAAAATCASFQSTCAARCRKDNPQDKACVTDHCSPKLAACKATGCWQEGQRYGGGQTCNLKRG